VNEEQRQTGRQWKQAQRHAGDKGQAGRQVGTRWKAKRQRWTVGRGCKEMGRKYLDRQGEQVSRQEGT